MTVQHDNESFLRTVIRRASGRDVAIARFAALETDVGFRVVLMDGETWTVGPGPMESYTVTDPHGNDQLVEFGAVAGEGREKAPDPKPAKRPVRSH